MTWYGADDTAPADDELAIMAANPALVSGRVTWATIDAERGLLTPDGFRRERLNVWDRCRRRVATARGLGAAVEIGSRHPRRCTRLALAIDASPTWRHATLTIAGRISETHTHVAIAGELNSLRLDRRAGICRPPRWGMWCAPQFACGGPRCWSTTPRARSGPTRRNGPTICPPWHSPGPRSARAVRRSTRGSWGASSPIARMRC